MRRIYAAAVSETLDSQDSWPTVDDLARTSPFRMTLMTITSVGLPASAVTCQVSSSLTQDKGKTGDVKPARTASADIADNLSPSAKQLLKRLAQLQAQLRDLRSRMQAAENAAYSDLAARNGVVASFQSQISAVTGTILLMSASLFQELDRSGGMNLTI
jgi:hypothetical protein